MKHTESILKTFFVSFSVFLCMGIMLIAADVVLQQEAEQQEQEEHDIQKAKIYEEVYPLLNEKDMYCSIFIVEDALPAMKIIGAEREYEKTMFFDDDIVYVNQGRNHGLESGQVFIAFEYGPKIQNLGHLASKRGRVRILHLSEARATAKVEESCEGLRINNYLVPFELKTSPEGKDLGYDIPPFETEGAKGQIVYLQDDFVQAGNGHWGILDIGAEQGLDIGQQMVVYRIIRENSPIMIFGNVVVINVQNKTATVKILSCRESVNIGDLVMLNPLE